MRLQDMPTGAFCDFLSREGIRRFFLVWDEESGRVRASHPAVEPLALLLAEDRRDFDRHEGVFVQLAPDSGVLQGAFIHRTCRGQGAGGVRFWRYATVEDFLRDGLRLARGMTHKNALAGLWWGGGKGVMASDASDSNRAGDTGDAGDPARRRRVFEEYGELLTSLRGCYVTAEDVGTGPEDMAAIFSRTRFTTCIPPRLGGSGNPSAPTARGVVRGMEAALAHRRLGGLAGKTVAVQGLGHVGEALIGYLRERGVLRIIGSDIDPARRDALLRRFPSRRGFALEARVVPRGDDSIVAEPADVFAPCATGAVLGPATIPRLAAGIVCGAANNQLEDPERDDLLLQQRDVLYLPDFLVNRMGIVNCADEQYGYVEPDPRLAAHLGDEGGDEWDNSIYNLSLAVLAEARSTGETPARVALRLAEKRSFEPHPIWGHRGADIIRSLVRGGWAEGAGRQPAAVASEIGSR
ncbi:MAG TPA: Glu/Leu/Phe/Val dehydrogenase dimerization domain-containing protein [Thermoanaerobaculia bacterium]|nr:Glu/Leu/Phe/Val dehydrogenase dimerization domain-containing protein [Thermoanaerobaculia bacterium]